MDLEQLRDRYFGSMAQTYDRERRGTPLWRAEDIAVRSVLSRLEPGTTIIDVPVGTGRFAPAYHEFGLSPVGVDVSLEMLAQAAEKGRSLHLDWSLTIGDICNLPFEEGTFDTAVCMRFLNWVDDNILCMAIGELRRVSRSLVVFGVRTFRPMREFDLWRAGDLKEVFLQWKWRFYQFRTQDPFPLHEFSALEKALQRHRLEVVERLPIKTKKRGFDYSLYVTKRT